MKARIFFLLTGTVLFLMACDPQMVFDDFESTGDGTWDWKEIKEFPVSVTDTLSAHRMFLQLRHGTDYPFQNLYVYVHVEGPSGQVLVDTVNIPLARPDGQWLGNGSGKLREIRIPYRTGTRFGESGTYLFRLEQAMRTESLPVTDVGIRIERINP
ncbi:MAG: gliding motility lipoprotein GldH [Bacteroidales bacterium]